MWRSFMLLAIPAVFFASVHGFAQNKSLGNVTIQELEQKRHPRDSSANAAILLKNGVSQFEYRIGDGFYLVSKCDVKIKVYAKDALGLANVSVPFYVDGKQEGVSISNAVTYNLVGGKIEKSKLKGEGEFVEKTNKFWSTKKFVMPNVKEGSIIEYSYTITSPYFQNLPEWQFQTNIPVDYSQFKTSIPEYYKYTLHVKGNLVPDLVQTNKQQIRTGKTMVNTNVGGGFKNEIKDVQIEYSENTNTFTLKDIPAFKGEKYVNNVNNYISGLVHELASVNQPGEVYREFTTNWESVARTIYQNPDFGPELSKAGYFESDMQSLNLSSAAVPQKIDAIFNHVRNSMTWDKHFAYSCDRGVKKAYETRTGNSAEINMILTSMLLNAGVKANPVLVSTRSNGVSLYPSRDAYNYLICAVESNDGTVILLDATSKFSRPDVLPARDLNWFGRLIRPDGSSTSIDLMPKSSSKELVNLIVKVEQDGKISGKCRHQYFDHNALEFRNDFAGVAQTSYLENLEAKHQGINVADYSRDGDADSQVPVTESYSFTHDNLVDVIGDKIYVSPLLFLGTKLNPFQEESRDYPVDFVYPRLNKYSINITVPDGYEVESLPSMLTVSMPDNIGTFRYVIQSAGKSVTLSVNYEMKDAIVPATSYVPLKDFYQQMIAKQNEKIVLKKV